MLAAMERFSILAFASLFFLAPAQASGAPSKSPPLPESKAAHLTITSTSCRWLVRHRPETGVAYQEGIDARGREVRPADLSGASRIELPEQLTIDLIIPLERLSLSKAGTNLGQADLYAGAVTIDRTSGRVTYNGQPLTDPEQERLVAGCRRALHRK